MQVMNYSQLNLNKLRLPPRWGALSYVTASVFVASILTLLRPTGVFDDSVYWVIGRMLDHGAVLYRDVFTDQQPIVMVVARIVWGITDNLYIQRAFLLALCLLNCGLFWALIGGISPQVRMVWTALFLAAEIFAEGNKLLAEPFILSFFLIAILVTRRSDRLAPVYVGFLCSLSFLAKVIGPVVFLPLLLALVESWLPPGPGYRFFLRNAGMTVAGAVLPIVAATAVLFDNGTLGQFWHDTMVDPQKLSLQFSHDLTTDVAYVWGSLLLPMFGLLWWANRRDRRLDWLLSCVLFFGFLILLLLRQARHYAIFDLCILAWMSYRAKSQLDQLTTGSLSVGFAFVIGLGFVVQLMLLVLTLQRGTILSELNLYRDVRALPQGTVVVFADEPSRIYMLLDQLVPAYLYTYVYADNADEVIWDDYQSMIRARPATYVIVSDDYVAQDYGTKKSSVLADAMSVATWVEKLGEYEPIAVGRDARLKVFRLANSTRGPQQSLPSITQ
jgi:hypothetical protein